MLRVSVIGGRSADVEGPVDRLIDLRAHRSRLAGTHEDDDGIRGSTSVPGLAAKELIDLQVARAESWATVTDWNCEMRNDDA